MASAIAARRSGSTTWPVMPAARTPSRRPRGGAACPREPRVSEPTQAAPAAFALEEVLAATGGDLVRLGARTRFPGVTTDSRSLRPDELFVALRGEAHDGHAFLGEA